MTDYKPLTLTDWMGVSYEVEIAFVRFLHGYVVWIDDDPWNDEPFSTRRAAERAVRRYFKGA